MTAQPIPTGPDFAGVRTVERWSSRGLFAAVLDADGAVVVGWRNGRRVAVDDPDLLAAIQASAVAAGLAEWDRVLTDAEVLAHALAAQVQP